MRHEEMAERLRAAYAHAPIPPLRDGLEPSDVRGAYAVQDLNTRYWLSQGRRIVGRKIGLTSAAVQTQLGVDRPDYGVLFEDMRLADGGTLSASKVIQAKAEAEVALILGRDLDDVDATPEDVLAATEAVVAAIEIVDSRISDWKITFADTVADNGSSAFFVLGSAPRSAAGVDLRTCGMVLEVNGAIASLGVGAACLGHPLNAAAWLARTLSGFGQGLRAGDVVMTGALGPMVTLKAGDHVRAEIGGLGSVEFHFAAE